MILAPLQLTDYWLDSISFRTNRGYDPKKEADLTIEHFEVEVEVHPLESESPERHGTVWMVVLKLRQDAPKGRNIPYEFALELAGIVAAHPSLNGERLRQHVEVNGPSMLYGVAREVVRAATGRGLHAPVILPSANFFQRLAPKDASLPSGSEATKKRAKTKSTAKKTAPKKAAAKTAPAKSAKPARSAQSPKKRP